MRGRHGDVVRAGARREQRARPGGLAPPLAHGQHRPDQRAHHRVAERVGADPSSSRPSAVRVHSSASSARIVVAPSRRLQKAAKSCSPAAAGRRLLQRVERERARPGEDVVPAKRVDGLRPVGHPVAVGARQRREARVEARRRGRGAADPDVRRQQAVQPAQQQPVVRDLGRQVDVRHLAAGVHPGVGAAGDGEAGRLRAHQHAERLLEHALHGAQPGLGRPSAEVGPVVRQVEPDPAA